jgi:hypothetical protein
MGCVSMTTTMPGGYSPTYTGTQVPDIIKTSNSDYAYAQATIDYGQNQLLELSRKATEVSLNMAQAANAAAQSTKDYNERQKLELDSQATSISLKIAQAAATQKYIKQQTKMAREATVAAQSSSATAIQLAHLESVKQTAQAQRVLDAQVLNTAQSVAAQTAYPLTATPFAVTQAALLLQQYDREQQSFLDHIVIPLIPTLLIINLLLFILVIILAYRWWVPMPRYRHLLPLHANGNPRPLNMIEGVIVNHDLRSHRIPFELTQANGQKPQSDYTVHVEIVNPNELPVAHWIAEVEKQLAEEGRLSP